MGRSIRDEVLAEHLHRVRARREDLRRILSGGAALVVPTLHEKQGFQDDYARLGPVEAGLAELLPRRAGNDGRERRMPALVEAADLDRVRERAALAEVPLLRNQAALAEDEGTAHDPTIRLDDY